MIILGILTGQSFNKNIPEKLQDTRIVISIGKNGLQVRISVNLETKIPQGLRQQLQRIGGGQWLDTQRCTKLTEDAVISGGIFCSANIMETCNDKLEVVLGFTFEINQRLNGFICHISNRTQEIIDLINQKVHRGNLSSSKQFAQLRTYLPNRLARFQGNFTVGLALNIRKQRFNNLSFILLADDSGIHCIGPVFRLGASAFGSFK